MRTGAGKVVDLAIVEHEEPGEEAADEDLTLGEGEADDTNDAPVEPAAETPEET